MSGIPLQFDFQGKIKDFVKKELCSQLGGLASEVREIQLYF